MWISEQTASGQGRNGGAALGTVTVGGEAPAVYTGGETRQALLVGPGCYWWYPAADQEALAVRAGELGEQVCLAGLAAGAPPVALQPGEALLYCGGSYIRMGTDGTITLHGSIVIEGTMTYQGGS